MKLDACLEGMAIQMRHVEKWCDAWLKDLGAFNLVWSCRGSRFAVYWASIINFFCLPWLLRDWETHCHSHKKSVTPRI